MSGSRLDLEWHLSARSTTGFRMYVSQTTPTRIESRRLGIGKTQLAFLADRHLTEVRH